MLERTDKRERLGSYERNAIKIREGKEMKTVEEMQEGERTGKVGRLGNQ